MSEADRYDRSQASLHEDEEPAPVKPKKSFVSFVKGKVGQSPEAQRRKAEEKGVREAAYESGRKQGLAAGAFQKGRSEGYREGTAPGIVGKIFGTGGSKTTTVRTVRGKGRHRTVTYREVPVRGREKGAGMDAFEGIMHNSSFDLGGEGSGPSALERDLGLGGGPTRKKKDSFDDLSF